MTRRFSYPIVAFALSALALGTWSCEDEMNEEMQGNWIDTERDFPGTPRGGAVCFQIGNKAFVGTGANTNKTEEKERYRDFYMCTVDETGMNIEWTARYDRLSDEAKATATADIAVKSMPDSSAARNGAVGFALNGKGYVGLGYDGTNYLRDFWCYDPETNDWSRVADYPGDSVRYSIAFTIGNYAYVGTGEDYDNNYLTDMWRFDGENWTSIKNIGRARAQASVFVWNGKGYVVGGRGATGAIDAFQCYDPATDTWEDLNNIRDKSSETFDDDYTLASCGSTAFIIYPDDDTKARAYITTGGASSAGCATWQYNPYYDYWIQKTNFEGNSRKFAVSFVLTMADGTQVPYVTTGTTSDVTVTGSGGSFYSDTWLFNPQEIYENRD